MGSGIWVSFAFEFPVKSVLQVVVTLLCNFNYFLVGLWEFFCT